MRQEYFSNDTCQIKRFKGRNKFELYIHDREFRERAIKEKILLPSEDLAGKMELKKKIFVKNFDFGLALCALCHFISSKVNAGWSYPKIQEYCDARIKTCIDNSHLEDLQDAQEIKIEYKKTYQNIEKIFS